jgi:hypothetical protein
MPCDYTKSLFCSFLTGTGTNCPTTFGPKTCDCPLSMYWTGSTCANRKTNGVACTEDCQCIQNIGLTCENIDGVQKCSCSSSTSYWTGTSCSKLIFLCFLIQSRIYLPKVELENLIMYCKVFCSSCNS